MVCSSTAAPNLVNSAPAFDSPGGALIQVAENTPAGQNIGAPFSATDADDGDTLTYGLSAASQTPKDVASVALFSIVTSTGQLQTKGTLDYEASDFHSHSLRVTVTDGKAADHSVDYSADATVNALVNIQNREDPGVVTLDPLALKSGVAVTASLSDSDGGVASANWQWTSSSARDGNFNSVSNGTSATYTPVAADAGMYLQATVAYSDNFGSGIGFANATSIGRVDRNTGPTFDDGDSTTRSVAENTAAGQNIGAPAAATEIDGDTLTYSLGGTDAASFDISASTGQLQTRAALDFETKNSYVVTVSVTDSKANDDSDSTTIDDTITVRVEVTNVDEAGVVTLDWPNPKPGVSITATVTDPDGTVTGGAWQWASSTDQSTWTDISGATSASYTPSAGDLGKYLQAMISSYTDPEGPDKTASVVTTNAVANNSAPIFTDGSSTTRSVTENTDAGQNIGPPITATDIDDGETLTYSLGVTDVASFDIDTTTGQLQTKAALDHETMASYTVTVSVSDGKAADGGVDDSVDATITVTISVTDAEDPGVVTLTPPALKSGVVVTASLNDPDGGVLSATWQWARSSDKSTWTEISSATSASYTPVASSDAGMYLRATVAYADSFGSDKSVVGTSIGQVDRNTGPTFDAGDSTTRSVNENTPSGWNIGAPVKATDIDGDTLTYTHDVNAGKLFGFSSAGNVGQIRTKAALDYETTSSYSFTLNVIDSKNSSGGFDFTTDDSISVTIKVINVNDPGAVTLDRPNPSLGAAVTATIKDPDGGVSGATWKWASSGEQSESFVDISGATSASYTPVESDIDQYLRATATYTDIFGTDQTASATTTSAVVSNGPPVIGELPNNLTIAENTAGNVGTALSVTDPNDDTITWSVGGTDKASFDISSSGQLSVATGLNYEAGATRSITVTASDGILSDSVNVTITVTDQLGEAPAKPAAPSLTEVSPSRLRIQWTEPANPGPAITQYELRTSTDNEVTWNVVPAINAPTMSAVVDAQPLGSYAIQVRATNTDGTTPTGPWSNSATITMSANTVPQIDGDDPRTISASESAAAGANIGSAFSATDPDTGQTIVWSLEDDDSDSGDHSLFAIDVSSGQVSLGDSTTLDYETKSAYAFKVKARDGFDHDYVDVTVTVTNAEDSGEVTLSPSELNVGVAVTATLNDPDGGESITSWQWARSADGSTWTDISGATSASYTLVADDAGKYLRATVSYTDDLDLNTEIAHVISAATVGTSNRAPSFTEVATAARTIVEGTAAGTDIGDPVAATDPEVGDTLTYSLGGADEASFAIDTGTGQLRTKAPLVYATKSSYSVTVSVTDGRNANGDADTSVDATITITVTVSKADQAGVVTLTPLALKSTVAVTASLSDPDGSVTGDTWQWARSATRDGAFADISTATSASYTPVAADAGMYLRATVSYTDSLGSGKSAAVISLGQVDRNTPAFFDERENVTRSVAENTPINTRFGAYLTATDIDGDSPLAIRFPWGPDQASFRVLLDGTKDPDDRKEVQFATKVALDYETTASYTERVGVSDHLDAFGDDDITWDEWIYVTINIINVDEAGVVTLDQPNPKQGAAVTASIADPDGEVTGGAWGWARSDDGSTGWSDISGATSASYTPVAADVGKYLRATISAYTDPEGADKSAHAVATGAVVVNRAPTFDGATTSRSVDENTATNTNFGDAVAATDDVGDTLTYSLGGADAASFAIDTSTGQLKTNAALDFETDASYTVTVNVTDGQDAGGNTDTSVDATVTVTISVTDVDEAGAVTLTATSVAVEVEITATLTDPDGGVSGTTWQWAGSADGSTGWTDISSATSASYTPVAGDLGKYLRATASYTDVLGSGKTASGKTTSWVADNSAPEIGAIPTLAIAENKTGDVGSAFTATDADGDTITWSVSGADGSSFAISSSGQLSVTTALNFEDGASRSITVTASDGAASDSVTVTVTVTNETEKPGQPDAPTVTATSGSTTSLDVSWDAPTNTGPAITRYYVHYCIDSTGCDAAEEWINYYYPKVNPTKTTIPSLAENTTYQVRVNAKSDEGKSPWSASSTGTTGALGLVIAPVSTQPAAADRITALGGLTIAAETDGGVDYVRGDYHTSWKDADSDYCNAREEVLKDEASTLTAVAGNCASTGTWYSWYDDTDVTDTSSLDIDHMVPLAEAHRSGGWQWPETQRHSYANDLVHPAALTAVTASSNRSKGARDPADWKPTDESVHCAYAMDWVSVKAAWALSAQQTEYDAVIGMLDGCFTVAEGSSATYSVALATQPTGAVTVTLTSSRSTVASVSPATLTFTDSNWDTAQTVTVTGPDDELYDRPEQRITTISHATSGADYASLDATELHVRNRTTTSGALTCRQPP